MKKIWKALTSRMFITIFLLILQFSLMAVVIYVLGNLYYLYTIIFYTLSVIMSLWIMNRDDNPAYKLAWIVLIMLVPLMGGILYLLFGKNRTSKKMRSELENIAQTNFKHFPKKNSVTDEVVKQDPAIGKQIRFFENTISLSAWKNTQTSFFSPGEDAFQQILDDLNKAEKFIFLEYFIIKPGCFWSSVLNILAQKAEQGVEVFLLYDDMGTISTLPKKYDQYLNHIGIKTKVFNPFRPRLNAFMNNRDHRKILIVDNKISYTGGINLADEYINRIQRFGVWKDSMIRLEGAAVSSFTMMFLEMWQYASKQNVMIDNYLIPHSEESDGYVLPFDDNPIDDIRASEAAYLNIINSATKYIYIETPYLVMDNELTSALCIAAQNGIDVQIVTPHIPDKYYVFALTRSSYKALIRSGVKIYEYTPGFIHSKIILSDDKVGIIGTANFDFRSLYLHFECGVWLYKAKALQKAREDFDSIIKASQQISIQDCKKFKWYQRALAVLLKVFAPLV